MSRVQVVYLHLCAALTAFTGIVFAAMKYFMKSSDEFSTVNHPLQPHMLSAHVVLAPLLTLGLGWVFGNHVWPKFRFGNGQNRRSGVASMLLLIPMTLSAYLLQISTAEAMRQAMAVLHWVTSGIFVISYLVHLYKANSGGVPGPPGSSRPAPG